ncbi:hypothetical protein J5N97_026809 [Dioscorea zingiberensis]|uniref:Ionotropic glutamate receptor C-terminal domain-containing protein n=1 Tax=Dioscorea zingiberensis TaxID=325984 RepID=A0A9D5H704_9LILI|nr:hypothetical protein J5N97_026809 [Dioscorea zingiberensis]
MSQGQRSSMKFDVDGREDIVRSIQMKRAVEVSVFSLWAYDTVFALAMAAEKISGSNGGLLRVIQEEKFNGVSGEFHLVNSQMKLSTLQVVNIVGRGGLSPVIWPGESTEVPKGWEIPVSGKKLRIGVPVMDGFFELLKVERDNVTNKTSVTGFCIDVFKAVVKRLPYAISYEFIPFMDEQGHIAGTYNDLVDQVYLQKYDAVVGDVTTTANRSMYVDFTVAFTESGVAMLVPVKESIHKSAWIFLKPLTVDLWFGKERVENILSKVVLIIWLFVVLILTSSYTASLTSIITVQQLQPTVADVQDLLKNGDYVGCENDSFIKPLMKQLHFDDSKIRIVRPDNYAEALSKGNQNGGVSAIIHEVPYIKLFLAQHCKKFTMVGPIYKTAGFGFVFPKGSPLAADISQEILNITEGDEMGEIERKWFGDQNTCVNQGNTENSENLTFRSFSGLFIITGAASTFALLIFLAQFLSKNWKELKNMNSDKSAWQMLMSLWEYYDKKDLSSHTFRRNKTSDGNDSVSANNKNGQICEESAVEEISCSVLASPISDVPFVAVEIPQ